MPTQSHKLNPLVFVVAQLAAPECAVLPNRPPSLIQ
jgi:hypothetical protein